MRKLNPTYLDPTAGCCDPQTCEPGQCPGSQIVPLSGQEQWSDFVEGGIWGDFGHGSSLACTT